MEGFRLIHQAGLLLLSASFRRNILHSVDCTFTEKTFFVVHEMSRYTWSKNKKQRQCQPCRRSFFALLKLLHGFTLLFYDLKTFSLALNPLRTFRITKNASHWFSEHLMTFLKTIEYFSGKNGALRWGILVGKQKHNVQIKHIQIKRTQNWYIKEPIIFVARDTHLQDACEQGMNLTDIFTAQQIGHKSSTSTDSCQKGTAFVVTYCSK